MAASCRRLGMGPGSLAIGTWEQRLGLADRLPEVQIFMLRKPLTMHEVSDLILGSLFFGIVFAGSAGSRAIISG
jgi:hypothetical protein